MAHVRGEVAQVFRQRAVEPLSEIVRRDAFQVQRPVVLHGDGMDVQRLRAARGIEQFADLVGHRAVTDKRPGLLLLGEAAHVDEFVEAQCRQYLVSAVETAHIRMHAHRAVATAFQFQGDAGNALARQVAIGVEAVYAELVDLDAGQEGEFGTHRIRPPGRHLQPALGQRFSAQGVELAEDLPTNAGPHAARIEKRFALHRHQVRQDGIGHGTRLLAKERRVQRRQRHRTPGSKKVRPQTARQAPATQVEGGVERRLQRLQPAQPKQRQATEQGAGRHGAGVGADRFEIQPATQIDDKQHRQANGLADTEKRQVQARITHRIAEVFEVGADEGLAQRMVFGVAHQHDQQPQGQHVHRAEPGAAGDQVQQADGERPGAGMQQPGAQRATPAGAGHQEFFEGARQDKTEHHHQTKRTTQHIRHRNPATAK
ncbi:hypothetical protein D3C84_564090 [compost metagenome]